MSLENIVCLCQLVIMIIYVYVACVTFVARNVRYVWWIIVKYVWWVFVKLIWHLFGEVWSMYYEILSIVKKNYDEYEILSSMYDKVWNI